MKKREVLRSIGIEEGDITGGNVGYEIENADDYFLREYYENRLADGLPVPDEFVPDMRGQNEKDLWRRSKQMERLESERCEEDKSNTWAWSDSDEREWIQEMKEAGYSMEPDRVVGALPDTPVKTKEEIWAGRWRASKQVMKIQKRRKS